MMTSKHTQFAWTKVAIGLVCVGCLTASIGCTQRNSAGKRAIAAVNQQQSRGVLGVELRTEQNSVTITRVEDGLPAAKAGLKPGDKAISVNGQAIELCLTRM
jgi:predicted metalloprotease with PDZ domain